MAVRICHLSQPSQTTCDATHDAPEFVTSCEITSRESCDCNSASPWKGKLFFTTVHPWSFIAFEISQSVL